MKGEKVMSRFNAGDRVRIRSWESMEKEFGLAETGSVDCARRFVTKMKHLCGREATISDICEKYVTLSNWSDGAGDTCWEYSTDMLELALHSSIHITTDGNTATATIEQNNTEYKVSTEFACYKSVKAATQAALDKAWNLANGKSTVRSVREVKRQAKVGEWVKIVKDCPDPDSTLQYSVGDILKITHFEDGFPQYGVGFSEYLIDSEYVVLEGYTPAEPEKPKYYNGKVVCVDASLGFTPGKVYAFKDGMTVDDDGDVRPSDWRLEKLEDYLPTNRFIEFKGEA